MTSHKSHPLEASAPDDNPNGLAERGLELYESVAAGRSLSVAEKVQLAEACRTADRLENLNRLITGDEDAWMYIHHARNEEDPLEVLISDPLKEARLQAVALRQLLAPFTDAKPQQDAKPEADDVSEIAKAREARRSGAAASKKRPTA